MYFRVSHNVFASGGGGGDDGGSGDGPPAPMMLEVGQKAEFYMVDNDPPSTRGGGSGRLKARIVRPLPQGSVFFKRAMAVGATGVVEECPSGSGGRRGAGEGRR